jgi:hypothetical protein
MTHLKQRVASDDLDEPLQPLPPRLDHIVGESAALSRQYSTIRLGEVAHLPLNTLPGSWGMLTLVLSRSRMSLNASKSE